MMRQQRLPNKSPSKQLEFRLGLGSIECLVFLGAHLAIADQKWTEQGREIKLTAIKMFKILIKNIQKR